MSYHRALALSLAAAIIAFICIVGATGVATAADPPANPEQTLNGLNGTGTADDPYVITDITELPAISGDLDANYVLNNDINATPTADWNNGAGFTPVGDCDYNPWTGRCDANNIFTGSFDGNGYTIKNLHLNYSSNRDVGLFGGINQAVIENVKINNISVTSTRVGSSIHTGGVVGYNFAGKIRNISVRGTVRSNNTAGLVVGSNAYGIITNVSTSGRVIGEEAQLLGGIAGDNHGLRSLTQPGFIARAHTNATVINNQTEADSAHFQPAAGGIVGMNHYSAKVMNTSATGVVYGNQTAGGIAGVQISGDIETSYFAGTVTGGTAGGVVGSGDLLGLAELRDYPTDNNAVIRNVYWDQATAGTTDAVGKYPDTPDDNLVFAGSVAPLSTGQLRGPTAARSLTGFDFNTTWGVYGNKYPQLRSLQSTAPSSIGIAVENVTIPIGGSNNLTLTAVEDGESASNISVALAIPSALSATQSTIETNENGTATVSIDALKTGTHTIEVTHEDSPSTDTATVTVTDPEAIAAAEAYNPKLTQNGTTPEIRLFANRSMYVGDASFTWNWTTDGENKTKTGETVTANFTTVGEKTVNLMLTTGGKEFTDTLTIDVSDPISPTATLTAPKQVAVNNSLSLNASNTTDNSNITDYEWNFDNGSTASGPNLTTPNISYSTPGSYTVELTVTDADDNTDTTTATIVAAGANASIRHDTVAFGEVGITSNATKAVQITNTGTEPLNLSTITINGNNASEFHLTNPPETVSSDDTDSIGLRYSPSITQNVEATLNITTNSSVGNQTKKINITGTGVDSDLDPGAQTLDFDTVATDRAVEKNVTITNDGNGIGKIDTAAVAGTRAINVATQELPTIESGEHANISVVATPQTVGDIYGTLEITDTDGDIAQLGVTATGTGPVATVAVQNLSIGPVGANTSNTAYRNLTISNTGTQPLQINHSRSVINGQNESGFNVSLPTAPIEPGTDAQANLSFTDPGKAGTYEAKLTLAHNDTTSGNVTTVGLSGAVEAAEYYLSTGPNLNFGNASANTSKNITIHNKGDSLGPMNVTNPSISGTDADAFVVDDRPEQPISPGESAAITVNLTEAADSHHAQIRIDSEYTTEPRNYVYLTTDGAYVNVKPNESSGQVNITGGGNINGTTHNVSVNVSNAQSQNVTFNRLQMDVQSDGFETAITNPESVPAGEPDLDGKALLGYVQLNHSDHDANSTFADTAVTYTVDKDSIPTDREDSAVDLARYSQTKGEWETFDPDTSTTQGTRYEYKTNTPGFSQFATVIDLKSKESKKPPGPNPTPTRNSGTAEKKNNKTDVSENKTGVLVRQNDANATLDIIKTELVDGQITEDEVATVRVILENQETTPIEEEITLRSDGDVVATKTVSVAPAERLETNLSFEPAAGEQALSINGDAAGTITVAEVEGLSTEFIWPEFTILTALAVSLVVVIRRRRSN
jgi:hypothetical protein